MADWLGAFFMPATARTDIESESNMNNWDQIVESHQRLLDKRGFAMSAEDIPPIGQSADWYWDVIHYVPRSGMRVARQLARLCGDDSEVTIPWRSLADAVAAWDKIGRTRAYTERGVETLVKAAWLEVETVGKGRGAKTTFRLIPGERVQWFNLDDVPEYEEYEDAA